MIPMLRTLRPLVLIAAGAAAASGCVDNEQSLQLVGFSPITSQGTGCTAMAQTNTEISFGIYDDAVPSANGYMYAPIVQNNLVATATVTTAERNNIFPMGVEVELHPHGGGSFPTVDGINLGARYRVSMSIAKLPPAGSLAVGVGEAFSRKQADALNKLLAGTWDGNLDVHTRAVGDLNGSTIDSNWYDFPIKVCFGCLLAYGSIPACPFPGTAVSGGCFPGQDEPVSCCDAGGGLALCGGSIPTKTTTDGGI